jgi:predicted P-loop ATPase/GTPase
VLTRGADQIVDTSNKLLETLQNLLSEERERVNEERKHRELCETSLSQHKRMIDELSKKVKQLETKMK